MDWVTAFIAAAREALARCEQRPAIRAISVAAQCHGLVLLDEDGNPLRAAKLWNDTTGSPNLARLTERIGGQRWVRRIGSLPTAAFTIAKLAWVAEHEPGLLDRVAMILLPHDYLTYWLTGDRVTDRSDASGTGYFDSTAGQWIIEYLNLAAGSRDWLSKLPTLLGPTEVAGTVRAAAADELGLHTEIIAAARRRGPARGLPRSRAHRRRPVFGIGTSGVVATSSRKPVFDTQRNRRRCRRYDRRLSTAGLHSRTPPALAMSRLACWAPTLKAWPISLWPPGTTQGPVLVPFFDGERKPDRPAARGTLAEITSRTTREELARAFVEGPLLSLLSGRDSLRACGVDLTGGVTVVGGGARSHATLQLLADLLGEDVTVPDADEATARGACVKGSGVAGASRSTGLVELAERLEPAYVSGRQLRRATGRDRRAARQVGDLAASPVIGSGVEGR